MTPPAEQSALHDEETGGAAGPAPDAAAGQPGDRDETEVKDGIEQDTAPEHTEPPVPEPRGKHAKGKHAKPPAEHASTEATASGEPKEKPAVPAPAPEAAEVPPGHSDEPDATTPKAENTKAERPAGTGEAAEASEAVEAPADRADVPGDTGPALPDALPNTAEATGTAEADAAGLDVAAAVDALAESGDAEPEPEPAAEARPEPVKVEQSALVTALTSLREQLGAFDFVLEVPGVEEAREARDELRNQLSDYVLPRVQADGKPMLVVLGGSTGAGKSTLVNTLVGARVSATGVLRPTTSSPILVCHPDHVDWYMEGPLLPGMGRVRGPAPDAIAGDQLVIIGSEALPPGLALLDSPDFDSVFEDHYEFATKLMAAADLWLCVTTAARYADAQVWQMLTRAKENGATIGVVLSRVPNGAGAEVVEHFGEMLTEKGVGDTHRFTVPETRVEQSRLPEEAVSDIRAWLVGVAESGEGREVVIGDTLAGVLDSFRTRVPELAKHVETQVEQRAELARTVESSYSTALAELDEATRNGSLLRGEVLARWQDFAGTGDLLRALHVRRRRGERNSSRRHRSPARVRALKAALRGGLESLIMASAEHAAEQVLTGWREHPAGGKVLGGPTATLEGVSPELERRVTRAVSSWQDHVQELIRTEGVTKRSVAKLVSFDPEALSLVLMVGLLGYGTADVQVEGGNSALPQRLLKALFGAESLRGMGAKARADLRSRIGMLFDEEAIRFGQAIDAAGIPDQNVPVSLYQATYNLEVAR